MKFLLVKLSSLGDIIHSLPIVSEIKRAFPKAQIDWLTGKKGIGFLKKIPSISNVHLLDLKTVFLLQKNNYDYVIDVQGLLKTGIVSKLIFGKETVGFKNTREFADLFYSKKIDVGNLFKTKKHIVDINLELVSSITNLVPGNRKFNIASSKTNNPEIEKIINRHKAESKPIALIYPCTTWRSKTWSTYYWFTLIKNLSEEFLIVICAAKSEEMKISGLIKDLGNAKIAYENLTGKTSLDDLIYLTFNSVLVIGSDSAGIHLASAINNDTGSPNIIGIYGPTSPQRNGPYGSLNNCIYLSELECLGCRKKICPLGHNKCMNDLIPEYVLKKVKQLRVNQV